MERRCGFTLIELLIVTAVIATLMGVTFRLTGVGGESRNRSETLMKLQRVENALSGYYAAFGSYPPVPVHGSQDITAMVDSRGIQSADMTREINFDNLGSDENDWKQVEAACRAQPVAVHYPFNPNDEDDRIAVEQFNLKHRNSKDGGAPKEYTILENTGPIVQKGTASWLQVQVFKYGVLSFLLPRYQFMLDGHEELYMSFRQWTKHNPTPVNPETGKRWESWTKFRNEVGAGERRDSPKRNEGRRKMLVATLASQAVCARWMPNLEGIISGGLEFFGVNTADNSKDYLDGDVQEKHQVGVYSPQGEYSESEGGAEYVQNGMTIKDGWGNEIYYYSPHPYQSYRLWSAGPDGKTFPPWYDQTGLSAQARGKIAAWTKDDIMSLDN